MKIVIPGGTGQVGGVLRRAFVEQGHEVVVLSRHPSPLAPGIRHVLWDGLSVGDWAAEIDGADVVVNLAGRTVSCRYTEQNLREMLDSRVYSTLAVGRAIERSLAPPKVWLQASTATIYAHTYGEANDEYDGVIGGGEPGVPAYWAFSVEIAKRWEAAQQQADFPGTRRVALRSAMVMSPDRGGVFDVLRKMTLLGLGGPVAGGEQYVSWIHDQDFVRAVGALVEGDLSGPVNLASPYPLQQRELMRALRHATGRRVGLAATSWMAEVGAFVLRTDTELLLKSRRVVPRRLLESGFVFDRPQWADAAEDLVLRTAAMVRGRVLQ